MPPGRGAVVRLAGSKEDFNTGPITLVSDRGVKYGVPNLATANALGLDDQKPAPENIVELQTYSLCVEQLEQGTVDAVTTDDAILAGYAAWVIRRKRTLSRLLHPEDTT